MKEIIKHSIIKKNLAVKMTKTIEKEIEEEIVKELNEIKSNDYQRHDPNVLVLGDTP